MQANVEAVRVAGLVTTLVSMAADPRRETLPNNVGARVRVDHPSSFIAWPSLTRAGVHRVSNEVLEPNLYRPVISVHSRLLSRLIKLRKSHKIAFKTNRNIKYAGDKWTLYTQILKHYIICKLASIHKTRTFDTNAINFSLFFKSDLNCFQESIHIA